MSAAVALDFPDSHFNPSNGRFMSQDPIGIAGGTNLYQYVANNPLVYTDPFGLQSWDILSGLVADPLGNAINCAAFGICPERYRTEKEKQSAEQQREFGEKENERYNREAIEATKRYQERKDANDPFSKKIQCGE